MGKAIDIIGSTFDSHKIAKESGWTWSCRRPGDSIYAFRVTWCPYNLVVTGDIGEIVVRHYSFEDPWKAAAWINGAGFDYFMEKSNVDKQYDAEETAEGIVEDAYRRLRDDRDDLTLFKRIIDNTNTYGEASEPDVRKEACRDLMNGDLTADTAYSITGDSECLRMRYPQRSQWHYRALKLWAEWMWENEPAWHVVVRCKRRIAGEWRDFKRFPVVFAPVLYVQRNEHGRTVHFNGSQWWVWEKSKHGRRYVSVHPLRVLGHELGRYGLWRRGGSTWSDGPDKRTAEVADRFVDVRPEWRAEVVA